MRADQSDLFFSFFLFSFQGITFQDYVDFFIFLRNIGDTEVALSFHIATGKDIDPGQLLQQGNISSKESQVHV